MKATPARGGGAVPRISTWVPQALVAGALYLLIGRWFPNPAENARVWRLGAWGASALVFVAHIGFERFRLRSAPFSLALHTASAVALGGLGLAIVGMANTFSRQPELRLNWLLALVIWPAVTALPAFLVALAAGKILERAGAERPGGGNR